MTGWDGEGCDSPWGQGTSSELSGLKEQSGNHHFLLSVFKNNSLPSEDVMRGDAGQASTGCGTQLARRCSYSLLSGKR